MAEKTPLRKLFDFAAESAAFIFNKQGYLVPMWVGINKKGAHIPITIQNMDDKDAVAQAIRDFLRKEGIVSVVCMLECWFYEGKEIPPEIREGRSLEENPDRREAIHILAEDRDGTIISGCYYILRPEHGPPKLSRLKMHPSGTESEGRFVKMFD